MDQDPSLLSFMDDDLKNIVAEYENLRLKPSYTPQPQQRSKVTGSRIRKLEKNLEALQSDVNKENEDVKNLEDELNKLIKELENKRTSDQLKHQELEKLRKKCEHLENWKLSSKDEQVIKNLRQKCRILSNITGVKFDFMNCSKDTAAGVVFNRSNNQIKGFSLQKSGLSQVQVRRKIIGLMDEVSRMEPYQGDGIREDGGE